MCVVLLADSIRNYITKFADDRWMYDNEFMDPPANELFGDATAADLELADVPTVSPDATVADVLKAFQECPSATAIPLVHADSGLCAGIVTREVFYKNVARGEAKMDSKARDAALATYRSVPTTVSVNRLQYTLEMNNGVALLGERTPDAKYVYKKLVTNDDLFKFVAGRTSTA